MKNILKKSFLLLAALSLFATGCNKSSEKKDPVTPDKEPSLTIDVESVEIQKFESLTLTYTLINSTDTVIWASSDQSVVTINEDGLITGVGVGNAYINARAGDLVSSCTVSVIPSTYAPTLVFDNDNILLTTEYSYEQDVYVNFKGEFVASDIKFAIKNGEATNLIDFAYDIDEGRLSITSKTNIGSTVLVAGIEIFDTTLVHEFTVTIL